MARPNDEVEALLQEHADLLAITGGDAFKARAYEKAARAIGGYHEDVSTLGVRELRAIPGVGRSIADKVDEYLRTGGVQAFDEVRARIPAGVRQLITIPTLGPKKAAMLHDELGIASVEQLAEAIRQERLRDLKGFGPRTEANILHGIELMRQAGGRVLLNVAMDLAEEIVRALSAVPGCLRCAYAGSLRRYRETIGDVDVLAAARTGTALEINSFPDRLDLRDEHILRAKRFGVKFAIDSDAHSTLDLAGIRYGVGTAQRGWLTPDDVINTWPLDRLRAFLRRKRRS